MLLENTKPFAVIAGENFPNGATLKRRLQSILHSYDEGEYTVTSDTHFLLSALRRHPRAEQKISAGVLTFHRRVNCNPGWKAAPGFYVIRVDGTEDSFSIYHLIKDGSQADPRDVFLDKLNAAMRAAIVPSILGAKDRAFDAVDTISCPISGREISRDEAHVDHGAPYPFIRIQDEFLIAYGRHLRPEHIDDTGVGCRFADEDLRQYFQAFHDERAHLRVVWGKANIAKGAGGYRPQFDSSMLGGDDA